jgi:hypothetical protein
MDNDWCRYGMFRRAIPWILHNSRGRLVQRDHNATPAIGKMNCTVKAMTGVKTAAKICNLVFHFSPFDFFSLSTSSIIFSVSSPTRGLSSSLARICRSCFRLCASSCFWIYRTSRTSQCISASCSCPIRPWMILRRFSSCISSCEANSAPADVRSNLHRSSESSCWILSTTSSLIISSPTIIWVMSVLPLYWKTYDPVEMKSAQYSLCNSFLFLRQHLCRQNSTWWSRGPHSGTHALRIIGGRY